MRLGYDVLKLLIQACLAEGSPPMVVAAEQVWAIWAALSCFVSSC
jgi:hypothetical protein